MALYVVTVQSPQPAWVRWDAYAQLPRFTFHQPDGMTLENAEALKVLADRTCGGTLSVVKAAG